MHKLETIEQALKSGHAPRLSESRPTSRETEQNARLLPRELTETLWLLMTRLYGHRWTSNFGDQVDPGNVWAACLRGLSAEQIKHGMSQCVAQQLDWPPSAPEFRKLCTGEDDVTWEHRAQSKPVHEIMADLYGLPDKGKEERARAAGGSALAAMKSLMGGAA